MLLVEEKQEMITDLEIGHTKNGAPVIYLNHKESFNPSFLLYKDGTIKKPVFEAGKKSASVFVIKKDNILVNCELTTNKNFSKSRFVFNIVIRVTETKARIKQFACIDKGLIKILDKRIDEKYLFYLVDNILKQIKK